MFKRFTLRIGDMKTISRLIAGADEQARISGEEEPGAEHFLLSALELPDGSAKRVFDRVGINADMFSQAVTTQYEEALQSIGVDMSSVNAEPEPLETERVFHSSKPSGEAVMKKLHKLKKTDKDRPLLGAHVVAVVATMKHGVAARALRSLGVEIASLQQAVDDELVSV